MCIEQVQPVVTQIWQPLSIIVAGLLSGGFALVGVPFANKSQFEKEKIKLKEVKRTKKLERLEFLFDHVSTVHKFLCGGLDLADYLLEDSVDSNIASERLNKNTESVEYSFDSIFRFVDFYFSELDIHVETFIKLRTLNPVHFLIGISKDRYTFEKKELKKGAIKQYKNDILQLATGLISLRIEINKLARKIDSGES